MAPSVIQTIAALLHQPESSQLWGKTIATVGLINTWRAAPGLTNHRILIGRAVPLARLIIAVLSHGCLFVSTLHRQIKRCSEGQKPRSAGQVK